MRQVRRAQRVGFLVCILAGWSAAGPARAQSLHLVECASDQALAALLEAGLVVSQRSGSSCFVFGPAAVASVARQLGFASRVLDTETEGVEHYLVDAESVHGKVLPRLFRVLPAAEHEAVIAVPSGQLETLLAAGVPVRRLFPRPLRLPRKAAPSRTRMLGFDAEVATLVARVTAESLQANVARLEAFGSRNSTKAGGREAAEWLAARFRGFGIEQVQIRQWSSQHAGNVVATLPGRERPDEILLLGGHFDSIVPESDFEPGADDNASGTSTLLEIARILSSRELASTLRFVAFSGEEHGLLGSEAYAASAAAQGEDIVAMLNFDMLGHVSGRDRRDLDLITNDWSEWLLQSTQDVAAAYVPGFPVLRGKLQSGRSDHESFWAHGYHAVFFFEDSSDPSPFAHTTDDVIGPSYNDTTLHALSTRVALAWVATMAGVVPLPVTLQSFAVEHRGHSVRLQWRLALEAARRLRGVAVERAMENSGPWEVRTATPLSPLETEYDDALAEAAASWWYRLRLEGQDGSTAPTPPLLARWQTSGTGLDAVLEIDGAFHVRFHVGAPTELQLGVYDARGRLQRRLAAGSWPPGEYLSVWDGRDRGGAAVARGIYVVSLRGATTNAARKIVVR